MEIIRSFKDSGIAKSFIETFENEVKEQKRSFLDKLDATFL